jgi:hypothetical protein
MYTFKDSFHYFAPSNYTPSILKYRPGWFRYSIWKVQNRDGSMGRFTSVWLFNHLQAYWGSSKCDGTESYAASRIVMVDKPSELSAFRWRSAGPGSLSWDNMGGS